MGVRKWMNTSDWVNAATWQRKPLSSMVGSRGTCYRCTVTSHFSIFPWPSSLRYVCVWWFNPERTSGKERVDDMTKSANSNVRNHNGTKSMCICDGKANNYKTVWPSEEHVWEEGWHGMHSIYDGGNYLLVSIINAVDKDRISILQTQTCVRCVVYGSWLIVNRRECCCRVVWVDRNVTLILDYVCWTVFALSRITRPGSWAFRINV